MKSPLVSILIPVFNREKLIAHCIQSALDQTFQDFEVVVVDNCSTDKTWEVCQQFAAKDARVRVFRNNENVGPVRNWLRCIGEAKGEFGKILFSDDLLHPQNLEKTAPYLTDNAEVGFVISTIHLGGSPEDARLEARFADKTGVYPSSSFIEASLFGGEVSVSPGNALLRLADLRKNLLLEIPSPTIKNFLAHGAGPDLLIYLLTAQAYPSIAFVNEPLCFFKSHEGSITASTKAQEINRYYTQASIWFAERYLSEQERNRYLVYAWYRTCQSSRPKRWVKPSTFLRDFSSNTDISLFFPILKFALSKLSRKFV